MDVKTSKRLVRLAMRHNVTPLLWGKHGCGKSQIVQQIAEEDNLQLIDLRLGQMESGDLVGIPDRDGDTTVWLRPTWFPKEGTSGILFLDELNRARLDVLQAVFQLVLDRRLNTHKLPDSWYIVSACNPNSDDYFVTDLDAALMNRFLHIKFTPQHSEFIEHATSENYNKHILSFIKEYPNLLGNEAIDMPIEIKPTPRGWEMFSRIMTDLDPENTEDHTIIWEAGAGLVGHEAVIPFIESFKHTKRYIRGKEILKSFHSALTVSGNKVSFQPKKGDQVVKDFMGMVKPKDGEVRFDLVNMSLEEVLDVTTKSDYYFEEQAERSFIAFLCALPVDLRLGCIKKLNGISGCPAHQVMLKSLYNDILWVDTKAKIAMD